MLLGVKIVLISCIVWEIIAQDCTHVRAGEKALFVRSAHADTKGSNQCHPLLNFSQSIFTKQ
jgi:hypothetical protein